MAQRRATITAIDDVGVSLALGAGCAACTGCAGACRTLGDVKIGIDALRTFARDAGRPLESFAVGDEMLLAIDERRLRRDAVRLYGGSLAGLVAGALAAHGIVTFGALVGLPFDPHNKPIVDGIVLLGAALGTRAAWRGSQRSLRGRIPGASHLGLTGATPLEEPKP